MRVSPISYGSWLAVEYQSAKFNRALRQRDLMKRPQGLPPQGPLQRLLSIFFESGNFRTESPIGNVNYIVLLGVRTTTTPSLSKGYFLRANFETSRVWLLTFHTFFIQHLKEFNRAGKVESGKQTFLINNSMINRKIFVSFFFSSRLSHAFFHSYLSTGTFSPRFILLLVLVISNRLIFRFDKF